MIIIISHSEKSEDTDLSFPQQRGWICSSRRPKGSLKGISAGVSFRTPSDKDTAAPSVRADPSGGNGGQIQQD